MLQKTQKKKKFKMGGNKGTIIFCIGEKWTFSQRKCLESWGAANHVGCTVSALPNNIQLWLLCSFI